MLTITAKNIKTSSLVIQRGHRLLHHIRMQNYCITSIYAACGANIFDLETKHHTKCLCSARILRGLRLAARLNLSFSKETEDALHGLSSSVAVLNVVSL